jgi:cytochrome c oxidase subunit 1
MAGETGLPALTSLDNMAASWRAPADPWNALTLEWQVSSPPPIFNFDRIRTVVGCPYDYGVPGAMHRVFGHHTPSADERQPTGAVATTAEE